MVPPVERSEYLCELRNIADNIVRDQWEHSELHQPGPPVADRVEHVEVQDPADHVEVQPSLPESTANLATPVGPAFNIPMTQDKTLEGLPSQIDFQWQYSLSPILTPAPATAATTADAPKDTEESAFAEVSQIAEEAVVHLGEQHANIELTSN